MKEKEEIGSCGVYDFKRITRVVVHYDQRSQFNYDVSEYDRTIKDRKTIGGDVEEDFSTSLSDIGIDIED